MTPADMALAYPPPQFVKAMAEGRAPLPTDPERRAMVRRLVDRYRRRLGQSAEPAALLTPAQLKIVRGGTPREKLDLVAAIPADRQEDVLEALPASARYQIYPLAPPELRRKIALLAGPQQIVAQDLCDAKLYRAIYSTRQLQEVLADFWYNHFNVFLDKGADHYLVTAYERDAIRPHVLGKFKDLLLATAQSPAMLFYLDNWQSAAPNAKNRRGRGLNENYGRELLELHTLGVEGGYTQKDVTEVARCFTGWTIRDPQRGGAFYFDPRLHDDGEKTVLGVTIPAGGGERDGLQVLDTPGPPSLHGALYVPQAGPAVRGRRPAPQAGRENGAHVPRERRRHRRGAPDAVPRARVLVPERLRVEDEIAARAGGRGRAGLRRGRGFRLRAGRADRAARPAALSQTGAHRLLQYGRRMGE